MDAPFNQVYNRSVMTRRAAACVSRLNPPATIRSSLLDLRWLLAR